MDAPDPRSTTNPVGEPRPAVPEPRPEDRAGTPQVTTHVDPYEMRPDTTLEEPGYGFGV